MYCDKEQTYLQIDSVTYIIFLHDSIKLPIVKCQILKNNTLAIVHIFGKDHVLWTSAI